MSDKPRYTRDEIAQAAQEALGRNARAARDTALYRTYANFDGSLDELKRVFAGSVEAQKRGVDGTQFGVKFAEYDSLNDADKKLADTYRKIHGKNIRITEDELKMWRENGSAELMEAQHKGQVQVRMNENGKRTLEVSKKAWDLYGNTLLTNIHTGEALLMDKAIDYAGEGRIKAYKGKLDEETSKKFNVFTKIPKEHRGIMGSAAKAVGMSRGAQRSLDKAAGQVTAPLAVAASVVLGPAPSLFMDEVAAIAGGTRGLEAHNKNLKAIGLSDKDIRTFNQVGDVATAAVAAAGDAMLGGAPVFSTVNQLVEGVERESLGVDAKWGKVAANVAIDWLTFGAGKGLDKLQAVKALGVGAQRTIAGAKLALPYVASAAKAAVNEQDIGESLLRTAIKQWTPPGAGWQAAVGTATEYAFTGDSRRALLGGLSGGLTGYMTNRARGSVEDAGTFWKRRAGEYAAPFGGKLPSMTGAQRSAVLRAPVLPSGRQVIDVVRQGARVGWWQKSGGK